MEEYRALQRETAGWIRVVECLTEWGLSDRGSVTFKAETMRWDSVQREMGRAHTARYAVLDRMCALFGNRHNKGRCTMESIAVELDSFSLQDVAPCVQPEPVEGHGPERAPLFVDEVRRGISKPVGARLSG